MSLVHVFDDSDVRITKIGPLQPSANNAYIITDRSAQESLLVDMPVEETPVLDAISADGHVHHIVATHWHPDHWASYDAVRAATQAPVLVGDKEVNIPPERIDGTLSDGQELVVGKCRITIIHTPGHTPGSICLKVGKALISGDTLFNGGPGKTFAPGDLEQLINSIVGKLFPLPEPTEVMPGHGDNTNLAESRREYAIYAQHPHPPSYFGNVVWTAATTTT